MRPKLTPELHLIQLCNADTVLVGGDVLRHNIHCHFAAVSYTHLDVYKSQHKLFVDAYAKNSAGDFLGVSIINKPNVFTKRFIIRFHSPAP